MAVSSKGETATFKPPSNIEDEARGFKHMSNPYLGFATASLESGTLVMVHLMPSYSWTKDSL